MNELQCMDNQRTWFQWVSWRSSDVVCLLRRKPYDHWRLEGCEMLERLDLLDRCAFESVFWRLRVSIDEMNCSFDEKSLDQVSFFVRLHPQSVWKTSLHYLWKKGDWINTPSKGTSTYFDGQKSWDFCDKVEKMFICEWCTGDECTEQTHRKREVTLKWIAFSRVTTVNHLSLEYTESFPRNTISFIGGIERFMFSLFVGILFILRKFSRLEWTMVSFGKSLLIFPKCWGSRLEILSRHSPIVFSGSLSSWFPWFS